MTLIRDWQETTLANSCVTIGNFEGIHLGHQALIDKLVKKAAELSLTPVVVTFEPNPKEYFATGTAPRLMTLTDKAKVLESMGVKKVVRIRFDQDMAGLSAELFIEQVLIQALGMKALIVGHDFRYGKNREGDIELLKRKGTSEGFEVHTIPPILLNQARVSSTGLRDCLSRGDMEALKRSLGRAYALSSRVVKGDQRGRLMGFPTANLVPPKVMLPTFGVYWVKAIVDDQEHMAVANIGKRPTIGDDNLLLEVHLLDKTMDLYGKKMRVEFLKKIRDEKRFESLDSLRNQIHQDIELARSYVSQVGG